MDPVRQAALKHSITALSNHIAAYEDQELKHVAELVKATQGSVGVVRSLDALEVVQKTIERLSFQKALLEEQLQRA